MQEKTLFLAEICGARELAHRRYRYVIEIYIPITVMGRGNRVTNNILVRPLTL